MIKYLLEKEFKQIFRNPFLPRMIIMFPIMALLVFPLAANFEMKNLKLGFIDHDQSSYSRRIIQTISSSGYFILEETPNSYTDGEKSIELDTIDILLELPHGFEKSLIKEGTSSVLIAVNTVNGTKGGLGSAYLSQILAQVQNTFEQGFIPEGSSGNGLSYQIIPRYRYNPHLSYPVFMVPALIVMVLAMICGFLPALNIVSEKESGTIEQMNVTPVKKFTFIMAKLIPYWLIGFVILSICFIIARLVYNLIPQGNILTIYLFASVFILAISGFGLVISNYAQTVQQAMFMMYFFVIAYILLSGLYTPVESMPLWAQRISDLSPLKYFIKVMRLIYLKGSKPIELAHYFFALLAFAIFFNGWAILSYQKKS